MKQFHSQKGQIPHQELPFYSFAVSNYRRIRDENPRLDDQHIAFLLSEIWQKLPLVEKAVYGCHEIKRADGSMLNECEGKALNIGGKGKPVMKKGDRRESNLKGNKVKVKNKKSIATLQYPVNKIGFGNGMNAMNSISIQNMGSAKLNNNQIQITTRNTQNIKGTRTNSTPISANPNKMMQINHGMQGMTNMGNMNPMNVMSPMSDMNSMNTMNNMTSMNTMSNMNNMNNMSGMNNINSMNSMNNMSSMNNMTNKNSMNNLNNMNMMSHMNDVNSMNPMLNMQAPGNMMGMNNLGPMYMNNMTPNIDMNNSSNVTIWQPPQPQNVPNMHSGMMPGFNKLQTNMNIPPMIPGNMMNENSLNTQIHMDSQQKEPAEDEGELNEYPPLEKFQLDSLPSSPLEPPNIQMTQNKKSKADNSQAKKKKGQGTNHSHQKRKYKLVDPSLVQKTPPNPPIQANYTEPHTSNLNNLKPSPQFNLMNLRNEFQSIKNSSLMCSSVLPFDVDEFKYYPLLF